MIIDNKAFQYVPIQVSDAVFWKNQNKRYWKEVVSTTNRAYTDLLATGFSRSHCEIGIDLLSYLQDHWKAQSIVDMHEHIKPVDETILWSLIDQVPYLRSIIHFLTGSSYRIDDAFFFSTSLGSDSTANWWHRDQCGHRFKIYIPCFASGRVPSLDLLPYTHVFDGALMNWELFRYDFSRESFSRSGDPHLNTFTYGLTNQFEVMGFKSITVPVVLGDIVCFNTNLVHRTSENYTVNNVCKNASVARTVLQIELINKNDSDYISLRELGPCGLGHYTGKDLNSVALGMIEKH